MCVCGGGGRREVCVNRSPPGWQQARLGSGSVAAPVAPVAPWNTPPPRNTPPPWNTPPPPPAQQHPRGGQGVLPAKGGAPSGLKAG